MKEWNTLTNTLEVSIVSGKFTPGEVIVGQESGARYVLFGQNEDDLVNPYDDNDIIEEKAADIIDFSETNPFGFI